MALAFINTVIVNTFGIELSSLRTIDHSETACYILPVIEPGDPIIFPGQCDDNLAVVQNFEVDRVSISIIIMPLQSKVYPTFLPLIFIQSCYKLVHILTYPAIVIGTTNKDIHT